MVAYSIPKRLRLPLTPAFAILVGSSVALACMLVPSPVLEAAILDSGIAAILPAAAPPLGWTARTALAMITGGGAAAAAWLGAFLLLGGEGVVTLTLPYLRDWRVPLPGFTLPRVGLPRWRWPTFAKRARPFADSAPVPVLRRADAHPDAPARAPLMALRDLGKPFLDVHAPKAPPVEQDLPRDLDAPLSAFDPDAIPDIPAAPVPAVAPLRPVSSTAAIRDEGERFEAFELRPPVAPPLDQPPIAAPRTDATIHALLERLERGVSARGGAIARPSGIADTLSELRRLAR